MNGYYRIDGHYWHNSSDGGSEFPEEKLAHELVKMPPAIKNFTGHLYFSSEEHLPGYVAYNHGYRAPLDGVIFQCRKPSIVKMQRRSHQIRTVNNSHIWPITKDS